VRRRAPSLVMPRRGASTAELIGAAIAAWCEAPRAQIISAGLGSMDVGAIGAAVVRSVEQSDVDELVVRLFREEGPSLVRLVRLFVDDRNAAEDLVQEAFIRLTRSAHRIREVDRAAAYLRSIVLNLARDHNRRGLMSLRHFEPLDIDDATTEDEVVLRDDHRQVIEALRALPPRQRDCVVLRYHFDAPIPEIARTLGISQNSVKTHLTRALNALRLILGDES